MTSSARVSGRPSMVLRGVGVHAAPVRLHGTRSNLEVAREELASAVLPGEVSPAVAVPVVPVAEVLESQRQQAYELGFEKGLREGLAAAQQRIEAEATAQRAHHEKALEEALGKLQQEQALAERALARRFDGVCSTLKQKAAEQLKGLEQQAAGLVFQSLQKILGTRVHRLEALRAVIEQQVAALRGMGELRVHLHPLDLAAFAGVADREAPFAESVHVVPDERLPLGGCTVHAAQGQLDLGLPGQLARLGQVWLDLLAAEAGQGGDGASGSATP